jgi:predicted permease
MRVVLPPVAEDEWRYWAEHNTSFRRLAATTSGEFGEIAGQRVRFAFVSSDYFDVLGARIALGHAFSDADDTAGRRAPTAVLSEWTWRIAFGGDPDILGRVAALTGGGAWPGSVPVTIVGVAASGFSGPETPGVHLWLPIGTLNGFLAEAKHEDSAGALLAAFGRLDRGASSSSAQAELATLSGQMHAYADGQSPSIRVRTTDRYSRRPLSAQAQVTVTLLLIGVTLITLIACANVANLQLARGYSRRGEIAVRLALGASRGRVVRQLLTEATIPAVAAGVLGLFIARSLPGLLMRSLLSSAPPELAAIILTDFAIDTRVLFWTLLVSTLACLGFGLAPALECTRVAVAHALRDSHGLATRPLKTSLLSGQAIISVMALTIAGFMLRSPPLANARSLDRLLGHLSVVRLDYSHGSSVSTRYSVAESLMDRLASVVGAPMVAAASQDPVAGSGASLLGVTPGYINLLQLRLLAGRDFLETDSGRRVMIVNQAFARRYWPAGQAVGAVLSSAAGEGIDIEIVGREVIGVVDDRHLSGNDAPVAYGVASPDQLKVFLVRNQDPSTRGAIAGLLKSFNPQADTQLLSGDEWARATAGPLLVSARITGAFGVLALALGTVGFFTISEFSVRQRTREIGVRIALGARNTDIVVTVLHRGAQALVRGLLLGLAGALLVGLVMRRSHMPEGVDPLDPLTYLAVGVALLLAAVVAGYVPARRALTVPPTLALRGE